MEYLDFDLRLEADGEATCRVAVLRSPAGEVSATIPTPPALGALGAAIRTLAETRGAGQARDLFQAESTTRPAEALRSLEEYGRDLFDALMPAEVRSCYRVSLEKALFPRRIFGESRRQGPITPVPLPQGPVHRAYRLREAARAEAAPRQVNLVLNLFEQLKRLVPTK